MFFFVDADALIHDYTPEIESVFVPSKYIYMSLGSSGNFNSGVIITINNQQTIEFFEKLLLRADVPGFMLPKSDRCLYENGHVINLAKKSSIVQTISTRWNYTSNTVLAENEIEYILHGRGMWNQKPRSKGKSLSLVQSLFMRISQGSRYSLLKRISKILIRENHLLYPPHPHLLTLHRRRKAH